MATLPRLGLQYPEGPDPVEDLRLTAQENAEILDANAAWDDQGTLAQRPVSSPGTPGKAGRYFFVTSGASAGVLFRDYGTGWTEVNPAVGVADHAETHSPGEDDALAFEEINLTGTFDARPAAAAANRYLYYWAHDTAALYYNRTGSAWETVYASSSSGGSELLDFDAVDATVGPSSTVEAQLLSLSVPDGVETGDVLRLVVGGDANFNTSSHEARMALRIDGTIVMKGRVVIAQNDGQRAWYATFELFCVSPALQGISASVNFGGTEIDIVGDTLIDPLFASDKENEAAPAIGYADSAVDMSEAVDITLSATLSASHVNTWVRKRHAYLMRVR